MLLLAFLAVAMLSIPVAAWAEHSPALRVQVLSGDGEIGSARLMAARIGALGYAVEDVSLAPTSDFSGDVIFYRVGMEPGADHLRRQLGTGAVIRPVTWTTAFDLVVVTGRQREALEPAYERRQGGTVPPGGAGKEQEYLIGPQDVLAITVWDNADLSGKVFVDMDGRIAYQLVGRIDAAGHTTSELAAEIARLLSDGFIVNPQVSVEVSEYKSQKVFIIGEVDKPGMYYLSRRITLVEAISMAGGTTKDADREVVIVRPRGGRRGDDPVLPSTAADGEKIMVDFRSALEGDLRQNVVVQSGDSIFVPKARTFFIMGEVEKPGEYKLEHDTTVLKAISLAGGATETASINRTKVVRIIEGKEEKTGIALDALVRPNDTIVVPESFF